MQYIGWVLLNILFFDENYMWYHHQMTALAGNYVNFGVFEIYGDRALSDALDVCS